MQPNTSISSRPVAVLASRALKTVAIVIILGALLDIFIVPIPYQLDRQWQIDFATQAVDRGISLLLGLVLFLTGFWVDSTAGVTVERKTIWQDPRLYAFIFSSILGLFFLLLFPLHLNNVRLGHQESLTNIDQQATSTQSQLDSQIKTEIDSRRQQITQLLGATDEQLDELVKDKRLTQEQADLIRKFKADPKSVDPFLKQQEDGLRSKFQSELGTKKNQAQQKLTDQALKSGLRVGISSLLLAIGFIVIGWLGLRNIARL